MKSSRLSPWGGVPGSVGRGAEQVNIPSITLQTGLKVKVLARHIAGIQIDVLDTAWNAKAVAREG